MSMDEHDIEWRCGCGHTNPDYSEKCNGCGQERYSEEEAPDEEVVSEAIAQWVARVKREVLADGY